MRVHIAAITAHGCAISRTIADVLETELGWECRRYALKQYADSGCEAICSLRELVAARFHEADAWIFLTACGIAVRMIAPHIHSKQTDPAVLVMDEQGTFIISLLSGHMGKANALTAWLAKRLDAQAVITTATDIGGKFSPDSFALANGLCIQEWDIAKEIAACMVSGKQVGFRSNYPVRNLPEDIFSEKAEELGICITDDVQELPFRRTLHLLPKNLILGAGCRKGTNPETFSTMVQETLQVHGMPLERIAALHTIDLKREESALVQFCTAYKIPMQCYTAEELNAVEGDFTASAFVAQITGVDNVCERSAALGGNRLILRKQARNGITLALAERQTEIDFERNIL